MKISELAISGAFEITPQTHTDERGLFLENFRLDELAKMIGHDFTLKQSNLSVSKKGVLRGIHYADVPPGQAKYVSCFSGAVMDFIIDIRVDSPTFGQWDSVLLDTVSRKSVYLSEGLGHAFLALENDSTVGYLVSENFNASAEHGINPLDPEINLVFPLLRDELILSEKDLLAPTLQEAHSLGQLPNYAAVTEHILSMSLSSQGK